MTGARKPQRGVGLVELMIAITIGLAIVGGLLLLLSNTRAASLAQSGMAQLQDDQRLALTMLTNTVQSAAYFPNPLTSTASVELPADATFVNAGQGVAGASATSPNGDTLSVRYEAAPADGTLDCNGRTNTSAANLVVVNTFSLDANGNLLCAVNGAAAQALAGNVQSFRVFYGIDSDGDGSVDRYQPASAIAASDWASVLSVRVVLVFFNPLAGQPGQAATLAPVTQVIDLMSRV